MTDILLYAVTVVVWGSSWLAITYQLGTVAPEVSLVYRFVLAAALMIAFCVVSGRRMRFMLAEHGRMALMGVFLFSTNYFLIYLATQYLTSGLVAVGFSSVVVMNIVLGAVLFGAPVRPRVVAGAAIGMAGIATVFWPEIAAFDLASDGSLGLVLVLAGTASASLGMLTSGRNQKRGLPVVQTNAYGMAYGAALLLAFSLVRGTPFAFEFSFAYVASLLFLAVFATVIGFWTYLTLLGRIGADRAAYASVMFPVVALALSTLFEGFQWTPAAAVGVALVLCGNALVLSPGRSQAVPSARAATEKGV